MIYLLDANSFIQAKNFHYRMKVVPGFWDWLLKDHQGLAIQSIDHVYRELTKSTTSQDGLHFWAQHNKAIFAKSSDENIQTEYAEIANHVAQHPVYSSTEVTRFLSGADPWLIAAAKAWEATIVTHEVLVASNSKKVKIPNVAREFKVDYIDVFDLLEQSACELVLGI